MHNMVILDHHELFIYIDTSYPCSYHDVGILWHSTFTWIGISSYPWCYLFWIPRLGNTCYMDEEMFIMHRIRWWELVPSANHVAYNNMHASFKALWIQAIVVHFWCQIGNFCKVFCKVFCKLHETYNRCFVFSFGGSKLVGFKDFFNHPPLKVWKKS
jgi:hypothetical protein